MLTPLRIGIGLLTIALLTPATGCKQAYNGSFEIAPSEISLVKAYHRERQQKQFDPSATQASKPAAPSPERIGATGEPVSAYQAADPRFDGALFPADPQHTTRTQPYAPARDDRPASYVSTGDQPAIDPTPSPRQASPVSPFGILPNRSTAISPLDSPGQIRRMSFTQEGADFDVTLDHTGDYLIYSSTRHRATADLYKQRINGSSITQLTDDSSNDVMPAISPDGKTIAFASDRSGNWDLYLMDADGGPAVQLTSDTAQDIHPTFSPDGKSIVYCSLSERSGQWEMVTIDVENPTTKRYIGHGLFPQWSPSGDTILYQRARERGTRWFSVWTVDLDDRGEAGSPTEVVWSSEYACITPSWSPDGRAVVFCTVSDPDADTQGRPVESDLWIARADGSGRTRLTRGRYANLQPVWSGDSSIYFVSNRSTGGVENIWALDPDDAVRVAFPGMGKGDTQKADVPTTSD